MVELVVGGAPTGGRRVGLGWQAITGMEFGLVIILELG